MVQLETTSDTLPPSRQMCDRDCDEPAVFAYLWEWGEKGLCCAHHETLLQQTATNLNRTVRVHPLLAPAPAPLTRDQRTQLVARALVLEEELEEVKGRGLELYRQHEQLLKTNSMLSVREREAKAQLRDREAEVLALRGKLDERDAEHGELVDELERLRTLEKMVLAKEPNPGESNRG